MFSWFRRRKKKVAKPITPAADAIIFRGPSTDQGTRGNLVGPRGFSCKVIELPDRGNKSNISRIPAGRYKAKPYKSKRYKDVFHITGVDGRTYILTHSGNLAGDVSKGFRTHSAGCILLGKYFGRLNGQMAVMCSRPVVRSFWNVMNGKEFEIEIREAA